jgi:hypothetical protein
MVGLLSRIHAPRCRKTVILLTVPYYLVPREQEIKSSLAKKVKWCCLCLHEAFRENIYLCQWAGEAYRECLNFSREEYPCSRKHSGEKFFMSQPTYTIFWGVSLLGMVKVSCGIQTKDCIDFAIVQQVSFIRYDSWIIYRWLRRTSSMRKNSSGLLLAWRHRLGIVVPQIVEVKFWRRE